MPAFGFGLPLAVSQMGARQRNPVDPLGGMNQMQVPNMGPMGDPMRPQWQPGSPDMQKGAGFMAGLRRLMANPKTRSAGEALMALGAGMASQQPGESPLSAASRGMTGGAQAYRAADERQAFEKIRERLSSRAETAEDPDMAMLLDLASVQSPSGAANIAGSIYGQSQARGRAQALDRRREGEYWRGRADKAEDLGEGRAYGEGEHDRRFGMRQTASAEAAEADPYKRNKALIHRQLRSQFETDFQAAGDDPVKQKQAFDDLQAAFNRTSYDQRFDDLFDKMLYTSARVSMGDPAGG